jgi:AraC-like DNA-binding protein
MATSPMTSIDVISSRKSGNAQLLHPLVAGSISAIARAARHVLRLNRCVRISQLAAGAGVGVRQFGPRFEREIGIPPKLYARIARFEAALRRKAAAPDVRWVDVAHGLRYHDQMHMVHDFNRLSGDSPTAIGSLLDMFVQPELASRSSRASDG